MPTSTVKQRFETFLASLIRKLDNNARNLPQPIRKNRPAPYSRRPHHRLKRSLQLFAVPPELLDSLLQVYAVSLSNRYLFPRPHPGQTLQKREDAFEKKFGNDVELWKKDARLTDESFKRIRDLIKHDAIFKNDSHCPQDPVSYQLLLALCRFGGYGNKSSYMDVAAKLGVSVGSVENYTRRVIVALCRLSSRYVKWPTTNERDIIKKIIGRQSIFFGCVGHIDGSFIPFSYKPNVHAANDFFSYKHRYGVNVLAVCDPWKRFTYLRLGAVGSTHDQAAFEVSDLNHNTDHYLARGEYLLADSGYPATQKVISAFKKPPRGDLTQDQKRFNYELSRVRISVEHSFGILKERFQSLKEMRQRIRGPDTMRALHLWIRACFTLHNILLGEFQDEEFMEGMDRASLEEHWHQQEREHHQALELSLNGISTAYVSKPKATGQPIYRAALLAEAKARHWRHAYNDNV